MGLKAFVVEDNLAIRESLIEALAELADVTASGVAATEKDAVAWLGNPAHEWDLAIIDLSLAGGSGLGVLRAVQARDRRRKVVVLTGTASPDVRRQCEALGCDGVFDKAMETDALLEWCRGLERSP